MKTSVEFLTFACLLGLSVEVFAGSHSAASNTTTVDTRDNVIAVSGRVLAAVDRAPMSGATVTLAGQSTTSSGAGLFGLPGVSLSGGNTLAVSKTGFATYSGTVAAPAGATAVTVPDVLLVEVDVMKPSVTGIRPKYDGLFLSGASILNEYTASVDWNGQTPSAVEFYVNGSLRHTVPTSGSEATADIDMALGFFGSLTLGANKVSAVAVSSDGTRSESFDQPVVILPLDPRFDLLTLPFEFLGGNADAGFRFKVQVPPESFPASVLMPIQWFDQIGLKLSAVAQLDYRLHSGAWLLRAGARFDSPKLAWGGWKADIEFTPEATGVASQTRGLDIEQAGLKFRLDAKYPILVVYVSDLVPGGQVLHVLDVLVLVGVDVNSIQRIRVNGLFRLDADLLWNWHTGHFKDALITPGGGLQALYSPNLFGSSLELDLTGRLNFPIRLTSPQAWKVSGEVSLGLKAVVWGLVLSDNRWILLTGDIASSGNWGAQQMVALRMVGPDGRPLTVEGIVLSLTTTCPRPTDRNHLGSGPELFVALDGANDLAGRGRVRMSSDAPSPAISPLDAFRQIGRAAPGNAVNGSRIAQPHGNPPSAAGSGVGQADLRILENVFPNSDPALAGRGQDLMLLYVADNGLSNALEYTDIRWTRFDGTNWSTPATIQANTQAEFAPRVAYDGNGDAIAVWERVAATDFNQTNLTAMAAQMEVVWSKWNHSNGLWATPQPLTVNSHLDHAPLICGPMSDGSLLATWTANTANLIMGTNGAGSQVFWAQWSPVSQTWSAPQALLADLPNRLSQSLAGVGNQAVYAWTRDLDGVLTNANDQQVFYTKWSNGAWTPATQFTTDTAGNRNARVSVGSDGRTYLVWQSATNLVLSQDFSATPTLVRADSQTAGFADYAMTIGPGGNLALLWQEMSQAGSDAHYRVLDPASITWSKDAQLFEDAPLERSFAPVWDDVGNLTVAYNKVQILHTNLTVTLEGGGTVTITNVPQAGRVDLYVSKRQLIKDLALNTGDFTVSAENYLPGAPVTLSATLRNSGDLAVSNATMGFYDGNPIEGGLLITNIVIEGWFEGAATSTVSTVWIVPEPANSHRLFAVADPAGALTEFDEGNNQLSLSIGGTDLVVSLVSRVAETNGAVRAIAQVQNLGAPKASASVLGIRRAGATNAPLATAAIPELEPGRLAQVAVDLPPGTQPEGEAIYELTADDTLATSDVDRSNNTARFAVNLWLDSDRDGMPDGWEMAEESDPGNPEDAQEDKDGDGVSNLAEYLAGTDPWDPQSYLRIGSVAAGDGVGGVELRWGSVASRLYTVLRSAAVPGGFVPVAEHVLSTPPENVWVDAEVTDSTSLFYRIKVE